VLYQARIHPEQYSNTLPNSALKTLHETIESVCTTAAEVLGDSSKFPADWLFSYRWGKSRTRGKKGQEESNVLPNGEKIKHITVGGRTSAVVESRQKKIKSNDDAESDEEEKKPAPKRGKKAKEEGGVENKPAKGKAARKSDTGEEKGKRKAKEEVKEESVTPKKRRVSGKEANSTNGTPTRKSSRSKA
jgi:formamidopyrimidine-DNA glycosylase